MFKNIAIIVDSICKIALCTQEMYLHIRLKTKKRFKA